MKQLKILKKSTHSLARTGVLTTAHGRLATPFFMPIATQGTVKTLSMEEMKRLGAKIILGNSYHLYLKPGLKIIKKAGGLHGLMNWRGAILTDSGGFQVFSLDSKAGGQRQGGLVKITDKGAEFKSVYDGSKHLFTPRSVIKMQQTFGSDIMMVLDQCAANPCAYEMAKGAVATTVRWASKSIKFQSSSIKEGQSSKSKVSNSLLFGIVQGSLYKDLRIKCARELVKLNFDGYAVGGLAVGESPQEMYKVLDYTVPELPEDKPRYLMGVGYPEQIVEAVKRGIDMFDCVIPTREARHGRLYQSISNYQFLITNQSLISNFQLFKHNFYKTINIKSEKFAKDLSSINSDSKFPELRGYSKAYLRHLFNINEPLGLRLATLNNLEFYLGLMEKIRQAITNKQL